MLYHHISQSIAILCYVRSSHWALHHVWCAQQLLISFRFENAISPAHNNKKFNRFLDSKSPRKMHRHQCTLAWAVYQDYKHTYIRPVALCWRQLIAYNVSCSTFQSAAYKRWNKRNQRNSKSKNINWGIWLSLCVVHWIVYNSSWVFVRWISTFSTFLSQQIIGSHSNGINENKKWGNKNYFNVKSSEFKIKWKRSWMNAKKQKLKTHLLAFITTVCGNVNPPSIFNLRRCVFLLSVFSLGCNAFQLLSINSQVKWKLCAFRTEFEWREEIKAKKPIQWSFNIFILNWLVSQWDLCRCVKR